MKRNDEGGMTLDSRELRSLCYLMLSRIAADVGNDVGLVKWEDVPELSLGSWNALMDQFKLTAGTLYENAHNVGTDIDPRYILEQVS